MVSVTEKLSKVGDVVGCLLDIDGAAGTAAMSFTLNGKDMGVAFDGVKLARAVERGVASGGDLVKVSQPGRGEKQDIPSEDCVDGWLCGSGG